MGAFAIRAEGVSKRYRIGQRRYYKTLRDTITRVAMSPLRSLRGTRPGAPRPDVGAERGGRQEFWALRDVSFDVGHGEAVGIIGRNGAGKSTLLKILSRITRPTEGIVGVRGRVGSLLEVGTGFHPELTGRENVYLNGAILGMRRADIRRRFDAIVGFAEIGAFLDTPVKYYSSGMYTRLAFAVAAHLEPDVLVVDEVLAVGDAAFQKKCLGRMGDVAGEGRTVLFVSHNMLAVQSLCRRAIWIEGGRIVDQGEANGVVSRYLQTAFSAKTERLWRDVSTAPGNGELRLRRAVVRPADAGPSESLTIRSAFTLEFEYWNLCPGTPLSVWIQLYNEQGIVVFDVGSIHEGAWHGHPFPRGLFRSRCHVPGDLLNAGMYQVKLSFYRNGEYLVYEHEDVLVFELRDTVETRGGYHGSWGGVIRPLFPWTTERVESPE